MPCARTPQWVASTIHLHANAYPIFWSILLGTHGTYVWPGLCTYPALLVYLPNQQVVYRATAYPLLHGESWLLPCLSWDEHRLSIGWLVQLWWNNHLCHFQWPWLLCCVATWYMALVLPFWGLGKWHVGPHYVFVLLLLPCADWGLVPFAPAALQTGVPQLLLFGGLALRKWEPPNDHL